MLTAARIALKLAMGTAVHPLATKDNTSNIIYFHRTVEPHLPAHFGSQVSAGLKKQADL